ncbi:type VII secretion target [Mycolicibacterium lacusdiani]|uniref:type VII secretion target n=1 Tax=Mycolicibacterium lacusdiani TaxID=2895283 RepID=UPI001EED6C9D|nr:type VII secretion target [Mycolicibacterium lacusdiani]
MEPKRFDRRRKYVHADIPAIRALAASHARHSTDLEALAAALARVAPPPDAFGSVGADFLAAVADALTSEAQTADGLTARAVAASNAGTTTADAFDEADLRVGQAVGSVGI